jgi:hypothetical protein
LVHVYVDQLIVRVIVSRVPSIVHVSSGDPTVTADVVSDAGFA